MAPLDNWEECLACGYFHPKAMQCQAKADREFRFTFTLAPHIFDMLQHVGRYTRRERRNIRKIDRAYYGKPKRRARGWRRHVRQLKARA